MFTTPWQWSEVAEFVLQLDLTDQAVLVENSQHSVEDHATVADRAAGLDKARSGKLHESNSMQAINSLTK